ncbi:MAG TPA: TetR/AcrR family transcriptional regulator [Solirubrobacteraceae bacterium]|jgi:AcrR family transcriptional regulator|nr:TetR/AcrR family transcriptional regulator [Solirubrobacteraceae bacterium]
MAFETSLRGADGTPASARQRIIDTAYDLFSRNGLRAVGVDRIIDESGVARKTFYRHFPAKEDLILTFLDVRGQRWTHDWLEAEIDRLGQTPRERLLAIFDAFDEWFHREDFESCALIAALFEVRDTRAPIHQAAVRQLEDVRELVLGVLASSGTRDPESLAYQVHILMMGAIVSATRQDLDAGLRAREIAELLLDHHQLR